MTDIDAARSHLRIARSHIDQGLEHLAAADRDENTDEPGFTLTCDDCGHEFDPHEATHSIVGPHTAFYSCPNCANTMRGPEPYLRVRDIDRNDDADTDDE